MRFIHLPPLPTSPISWEHWVDLANDLISPQRRPLEAIRRAIDLLHLVNDPIPETVTWTNLVQLARCRGSTLSGSLLDFTLSIGDMGLFNAISANCAPARDAMLQLGQALLDKGVKPTPSMAISALSIGLRNLDGADRLRAAISLGASSCWDPVATLARCCEFSGWNQDDAKECYEALTQSGIDPKSIDFSKVSANNHPLVQANLADNKALFLALHKSGVSMDWTCPESGANLWHLFASQPKWAKSTAALLIQNIPHLAGRAATGATDFGTCDKQSQVRIGQTPLHIAAKNVNPVILAQALACGAPPNAFDEVNDTALLILARRWGFKAQKHAEAMVRNLLASGADPELRDKQGRTPAQIMTAKAPLDALAPLLEARPEDIASSDPAAAKALAQLSERGHEALSTAERIVMSATTPQDSAPTPAKKRKTL